MKMTTTNTTDELAESFNNQFNFGSKYDSDVAIENDSNIVAAVRDWNEWTEELNFDKETFSETPTGITRQLISEENPVVCYVFSSGNNASYFKKEYVESISKILGYDVKSNLDKLHLSKNEASLLVAEGDGFDMVLAPWLTPNQM